MPHRFRSGLTPVIAEKFPIPITRSMRRPGMERLVEPISFAVLLVDLKRGLMHHGLHQTVFPLLRVRPDRFCASVPHPGRNMHRHALGAETESMVAAEPTVSGVLAFVS